MTRINKITITVVIALFSLTNLRAQQTLSLSQEECRQRALAYSEDVKRSENKIEQAQIDKYSTATAFLPKIDATGMGIYMTPFEMTDMGAKMRMDGAYMAGVSLLQPIYTGGKILTGRKMAKMGEEVAHEQQRMTKMDVIVDADNAYWTYLAVSRKVKMMESYSRQMDTIYNQTQAALSVGLATENDMLRVEAKRSEIKYQTQKVQNGADLCRMSLCRVIGVDFETKIELTDTLFISNQPTVSFSDDLTTRPELKLLQKNVDINEQQIKMVRSDMLPTIALTAGYTYFGNIKMETMVQTPTGYMPYTSEFKGGIGTAMLAVQIPILHWGEGFKKVKKARFELENAQLDLEKNTKLLNLQVQQAIRNVQDAYQMIETATLALRQAEENLRVVQNRYRESMATLTDLLDAQSQWQQSESNYIEAQSQYKIYETEYLRATGNL
ncbi:MAG: TolC family protein [Bacteroidales bacterium]|nr:TolC family protein [Bacteroidales bacterium]